MRDELVEYATKAALAAEFEGRAVGSILSKEVVQIVARAAIEAIEKHGYNVLSDDEVDDVRASGYDQGYDTASELADADRV